MDFDAFAKLFRETLPEGTVLPNPGGGTSTLVRSDSPRVCYRRGKSSIYVALPDLYDAYVRFAGGYVDASQLKAYAPHVFDSDRRGHNCNCSFMFLALQRMGLAGDIQGRGRAGSPFGVTIARPPASDP